jgi:hypothetical protein
VGRKWKERQSQAGATWAYDCIPQPIMISHAGLNARFCWRVTNMHKNVVGDCFSVLLNARLIMGLCHL